MKKNLKFIVLIFCFCFLTSVTCFARAGGGGSGGGSSGGGSHSHTHNTGSGRSNPLQFFLNSAAALIILGGGSVVFFYKIKKAQHKSTHLIKEYEKIDFNWNHKEMQDYVEKAYFVIQECWRRQDVDYAEKYLSESLKEAWRAKLAWMKMRDEEEIQENVQLLSARPVKAVNCEGTENDEVWYLIHGKMKDYRINKITGEFLEGNQKAAAFYEYWRFIYVDGRWVLDEIRQEEDVEVDLL